MTLQDILSSSRFLVQPQGNGKFAFSKYFYVTAEITVSLSDSRSERLKLISKFYEKIKLNSYQNGETAKKMKEENDISFHYY